MAAGVEILVGVAGSIAAYKACDVVSSLRKRGAGVTVILTRNAPHFVAPLALATLSGRPVGVDLFDEPADWGVGHIVLAQRASAFVVVGATADVIAKMAHGIADDFVSTCALAARCPLVIAPAMNTAMWEHPATRENMRLLKARGAVVVGPAVGKLACGDIGPGKLSDPEAIARAAWEAARGAAAVPASGPLAGLPAVVTAGPTREPLDPVRFLSNPSSGKMGYALAAALRDAGARVTLISGPTALEAPSGVKVVRVTTALEMLAAARTAWAKCRVYVSAAAVSDFRPAKVSGRKVKKGEAASVLELAPNPDILKTLAARKGRRVLVGFAAETEALAANAQAKLAAKKLDLLVGNLVGGARGAFGADDNQATLFWPGRPAEPLPRMPKDELARRIAAEIAALAGTAR